MPAEARVALLLAKYAVFGVVPLVIPSVLLDVPLPIERIPSQQGTDLAYIQLARRATRLRLLRRARAGARHQHRLLGTARSGSACRSRR